MKKETCNERGYHRWSLWVASKKHPISTYICKDCGKQEKLTHKETKED